MRTVTLDILNDKAINLLKDLELLNIIRFRKDSANIQSSNGDLISKYKGAMQKQSLSEIDQQINDIRNEWK
ncbi:hypothetical protein GJU39_08660 [Pedobacter petrophilus]|uniref:Uncharacterized protein n=1 Tax=Pedobacter petrophilus TaxID=1908241 RepID=A0A7K0FX45_9SPHI|nr:hypothetical protein [Pedobacter petrophilus]MRX76158.1 hypothetical protein [Pedobacter petrophilus]